MYKGQLFLDFISFALFWLHSDNVSEQEWRLCWFLFLLGMVAAEMGPGNLLGVSSFFAACCYVLGTWLKQMGTTTTRPPIVLVLVATIGSGLVWRSWFREPWPWPEARDAHN